MWHIAFKCGSKNVNKQRKWLAKYQHLRIAPLKPLIQTIVARDPGFELATTRMIS